ncbi:MAG: hypothetical protein ACKVZ6_22590 [Kineosporiaceae bacterium]|jgi:threonine/homoserine efflux transporter RhtA
MTTTRPPDRELLGERLRSRTRLFGALLVAAVLALFLPLPWRLAGLGFALATVVVGARLLFTLAQWRRLGGRGSGFVGVSVGLGLAAVLVVQLGVQAALYPLYRDREACLAKASTIQAKDRCAKEFSTRLQGAVPPGRPTAR